MSRVVPTAEDWERVKPAAQVGDMTYFRDARHLYPREVDLMDDLLDGKVPQPWASRIRPLFTAHEMAARRMERALDRAVEKVVEVADRVLARLP